MLWFLADGFVTDLRHWRVFVATIVAACVREQSDLARLTLLLEEGGTDHPMLPHFVNQRRALHA
jgi:hypothetical protein